MTPQDSGLTEIVTEFETLVNAGVMITGFAVFLCVVGIIKHVLDGRADKAKEAQLLEKNND